MIEPVLKWFDQHGRKDLPWQEEISPYRVWISETMLQQTQVNTVIPYFHRFIARFPDIDSLAHAPQDEVLHLWSGLGYYARARNLQRTAQIIVKDYSGKFPDDSDTLQSLPGIGRSTAGAILSIAFQKPAAILDGNVKRVLSRYHATSENLWELAESHLPTQRIADYTQAMMDLGATVCTRTKPRCITCPLEDSCVAHAHSQETNYPAKKQKKIIPVKTIYMLLLCNDAGEILLEKRPPTGIWGGLWSLPECPKDTDIAAYCEQKYAYQTLHQKNWSTFRHTFSHFHLDITPVQLQIINLDAKIMDSEEIIWYNAHHTAQKGLPAPITQIIKSFFKQ